MRERDWVELQIQHGQVEIFSQGAGWGSVDGILPRENVRGKGCSG